MDQGKSTFTLVPWKPNPKDYPKQELSPALLLVGASAIIFMLLLIGGKDEE